jgi:hypothetical protein
MPKKQDSLNNDLFDLLQSRGYSPVLLNTAGKEIPVPEEAEVFQFQFEKDGKDYGTATVSIDGLRKLVVYFGDKIASSPKLDTADSESWYHLLRQIRRFAQKHQLSFETRNIDKLEYDMAKREHTKKLDEGYYSAGKKASISDNTPTVKMRIQHTREIQEGEQRFRNIARIFVENNEGERFLIPTNKPGLARVFARHIAEGGTPYDDRGQHIGKIVEEYQHMAGFVRATRNGQFNESAQRLVNEGINHYQKLRESLHKMAGKRGYNEYFENWSAPLMEDEEQVDLSEMFMSSSLDPRIENVMPILSKLSKNITETAELSEVKELEEWADRVTEGDVSVAEGYDPVESNYQQWEDILQKDGYRNPDVSGAYALELVVGHQRMSDPAEVASTIRNILTYVKQNRQVLGKAVSDRTTVKDAIIDIKNKFPQQYQAASQQPMLPIAENATQDRLGENQEWDVYTVVQGNKAVLQGSITATDENAAIQAVYDDPRPYGYKSRAYAWIPFVKPKGSPLPVDLDIVYKKIMNSNLPDRTKDILTSMITGNHPGGKDSPEKYYKTGNFSPKVQQYIDKISQQGMAEGEGMLGRSKYDKRYLDKFDPTEVMNISDDPEMKAHRTTRQGSLRTSKEDLTFAFGPPGEDDTWVLEFRNGLIATIYPQPNSDLNMDWFIGGNHPDIEDYVLKAYSAAINDLEEGLAEGRKDRDDDLIGGRYTQDEWDRMVNRLKQLAHKQEAEKKAKQAQPKPEQKTDESIGGPQQAAGQLDATSKVTVGGKILGEPLKSQQGLRGKLVGGANESVEQVAEEVDTGQYDARKSSPKGKDDKDWDKNFHEKVKQYGKELEQRQKEKEKKEVKEGQEDLDAILRIIKK